MQSIQILSRPGLESRFYYYNIILLQTMHIFPFLFYILLIYYFYNSSFYYFYSSNLIRFYQISGNLFSCYCYLLSLTYIFSGYSILISLSLLIKHIMHNMANIIIIKVIMASGITYKRQPELSLLSSLFSISSCDSSGIGVVIIYSCSYY